MVFNRLHLSLMATSSNPAASIFGPTFFAKTQYSTLTSYAATYFPSTCIIGGCGIYTKGSLIEFKKVRGACKMMIQKSNSIRCDLGSNSFRELDDSRKRNSIGSLSMLGFASHPLPSTSSSRNSSKSVKSTYVAYSKKMLSTKAMPGSGLSGSSTSESIFVKDGKSGRNSSKPIVSNKYRQRVKAFKTQVSTEGSPENIFPSQVSWKNIPDHRVSAQKDINSVNSIELLERDEQKEEYTSHSPSAPSSIDSKAEPKSEKKPKKRSQKKKKEEPSDSSPDAVPSGGTRRGKRLNGLSAQIPESSSTVDITKDEAELSGSPQVVPKKKASKSRKKGRSLKEDDLEKKINGALHEPEKVVEEAPSTCKAPQKPKPPIVSGIKSIKLKPLYPPTGKSVLVVESLTKAKVIQHYLGDMYEVIPSYGHVRDLAARSGSVRPDDDFGMVWEVPSSAWTHLKSMKVALSGAENLILASDPDREGEAIAWHIIEMLQQQKALHNNMTIARVVFQEVTELAIKNALQSPRDIDVNLVHAYLARRALDYLIGFNISPLLWRKLPGCQSAGRVQSAALSLICDRELEIEEFKPQEYWSVETTFNTSNTATSANTSSLRSYLTHFNSKKLNQFSIGSETEAKIIEQNVSSSNFKVTAAKNTKVNRNPPTPYITSTLQQDAANKLSFSASYTMKLAQKLYEGIQFADGKAAGLITYMRTDGLHISDEAVREICSLVKERYGMEFAASSPRKFFKKVKNAQEAHEAIRPTDIRRLPSMLVGVLDEDSVKLYSLIWARTVACQMEAARVDQIQLDIGNDSGSISFRAACTAVEFPGFRSVYEDVESQAIRGGDKEPSDRDELYKILSNIKQGDSLFLGNLETRQHHTQPPPRYSEASLVKKMEELGIGRPSTYASILRVLQDRKYVTAKNRVLNPEFRGRMVSAFLSHYFNEVTDYSFTADMETELDNVSAGSTEWKGLLEDYWGRFSTYCERAGKVHIHQVEKMLERTYENFLFSSLPDESRICPSCLEGTLTFKVSRYGAGYFIGCDQHPKCKFIAKTLYGEEEDDEAPPTNVAVEEPKLLGTHPISGEKILLKGGPYGSYVQLGEDRKGYLPKRSSVSQIKNLNSITLDDAVDLLRYPITLGNHHDDGQPIVIKISKTGFTVRHRRTIAPVPKELHPGDIDMKKALELLAGPGVKRSGRPKGKKREEVVDDY